MRAARHAAAAAALAALALAGCAGDAPTKADDAAVRDVVSQFALATGPHACRYLTPDGLVDVYGGFTDPPAKARATCKRASARFKPAKVRVTQVKFLDDRTAKVGALRADGRVNYTVTLRKPHRHWLIDEITQGRPD